MIILKWKTGIMFYPKVVQKELVGGHKAHAGFTPLDQGIYSQEILVEDNPCGYPKEFSIKDNLGLQLTETLHISIFQQFSL